MAEADYALAGSAGSVMTPSGIVTLLTDFGVRDPFVGVMKGVMLSIDVGLRLVDLAHGVRPQSVVEGEFFVSTSHRFFPPGTVHMVVVDPGVGTRRAAIVAETDQAWFVAPDNGVLTSVLPSARVRAVDVERHGRVPLSATFHGRDVFAPVAARLAAGALRFEDVGPLHTPALLERSAVRVQAGRCVGKVVSVDHFGNLITDIPGAAVRELECPVVSVATRDVLVRETYGSAEPGDLVAVVNAYGTVEVAMRDGDAAAQLGLRHGALVELRSG